MKIRVFTTGGTFDKEYDEIKQELVLKGTCMQKLLERARCTLSLEVTSLMTFDSLHLTEAHRNIILENCRNAQEDKIVITHGTDTIVKTAELLAKGVEGKTIVLTGALVPYEFRNSDSLFNLGTAIAFVQLLSPGVYIAMNGKIFTWDNCRKNEKTGVFEELR